MIEINYIILSEEVERLENKELKDIESDLHYDINELRNEFRSFKRRFSILTNIIVPGIGFFIFDIQLDNF